MVRNLSRCLLFTEIRLVMGRIHFQKSTWYLSVLVEIRYQLKRKKKKKNKKKHCRNEMSIPHIGGGGLTSVLDVQSLFFLLKKIEFAL